MQVFKDNPWFASLPAALAGALLDAATPMSLSAGKTLYRQGDVLQDANPAFFGVARGTLKLSILHSDGNEGILTMVEPGNWIGEVALLESMERAHTATALEDSELVAVSAGRFDALMREAGFAAAVARLVAGRLRVAYGLLGLSQQSTRERVVRRLVLMAHGDVTLAADQRHRISTSQDNLAMMLGISRPTLNKELQALVKAGAIAVRYGSIEIRDMGLLQRVATQPRE